MAEGIPQGCYDNLIDGGIPIGGLRYVRYMDQDGRSFFRWEFDGEVEVSVTIGDLQHIVFSLLANVNFEDMES